MTDNVSTLFLGTTLGIALGASIFVVILFLIAFITSYVYEQTISREIKAYLIAFACVCVALILLSTLSLRELIYNPPLPEATVRLFWDSSNLSRALFLSTFLVLCASMFLFLVGPFELARRIRLQLVPTSRRRVRKSNHLKLKVETDIPARLDRLPWGAFHSLVAVALGITWILNGLEVTLAGIFSGVVEKSLNLSDFQVQNANSAYLAGLVLGSLVFGWLTDRLGRKKLFFVTLIVYLLSTFFTGFAWNFATLLSFRFLTGLGIGGEYAAINSAIQELIPAKFRGRTDLLISGTFWIGAVIGAVGSTVLLDSTIIYPELGWRVAFWIGAVLALLVLLVRPAIPESPRWLMTHNRLDEAEAIVAGIEDRFKGQFDSTELLPRVQIIGRNSTPLLEVVKTIFQVYPARALVSFSLMAAQAFVYNAIFFTHAEKLERFFNIHFYNVGWYFLPFAIGNFLGPVFLGPLFDRLGRKQMISGTYLISGLLLVIIGYLFKLHVDSALILSLALAITFFFASAAASAAYLTVGEIFPLEIRAFAIAFFFALGTGFAVLSPSIFTVLVEENPYKAYLILSIVMILAALIEWLWGVDAECKPLEAVASPLTFVK
jgi:MFS family permease